MTAIIPAPSAQELLNIATAFCVVSGVLALYHLRNGLGAVFWKLMWFLVLCAMLVLPIITLPIMFYEAFTHQLWPGVGWFVIALLDLLWCIIVVAAYSRRE